MKLKTSIFKKLICVAVTAALVFAPVAATASEMKTSELEYLEAVIGAMGDYGPGEISEAIRNLTDEYLLRSPLQGRQERMEEALRKKGLDGAQLTAFHNLVLNDPAGSAFVSPCTMNGIVAGLGVAGAVGSSWAAGTLHSLEEKTGKKSMWNEVFVGSAIFSGIVFYLAIGATLGCRE